MAIDSIVHGVATNHSKPILRIYSSAKYYTNYIWLASVACMYTLQCIIAIGVATVLKLARHN